MVMLDKVAQRGRKLRRPLHRFNVAPHLWELQPFMAAPVLPGDTLRNALMQVRAVSDPLKNPLLGLWAEFYLFYVKLRDLDGRETFENMLIKPGFSTTPVQASASSAYYTRAGSLDLVKQATKRVAECYFYNEGQALVTSPYTTGLYVAQAQQAGPFDSILSDAAWDSAAFNQDVVIDDTGGITAAEVQAALQEYTFARSAGLTQDSYEDYLRNSGVSVGNLAEERHWPELIRYVRDWTYPSNTIDPATGSPSSAASWSIAERADKDRFCKEPGLLLGVCCFRPKVYFAKQRSAVLNELGHAYDWMPTVLLDDPQTSYKNFTAAEGPGDTTAPYYIDLRDLYTKGDQFVSGTVPGINVPRVDMGRTADKVSCDGYFKADTATQIRVDGVVQLSIASRVDDLSRPSFTGINTAT